MERERETILMANLTITLGYFTDLFVDIFSTSPDKVYAVCHKCMKLATLPLSSAKGYIFQDRDRATSTFLHLNNFNGGVVLVLTYIPPDVFQLRRQTLKT